MSLNWDCTIKYSRESKSARIKSPTSQNLVCGPTLIYPNYANFSTNVHCQKENCLSGNRVMQGLGLDT